MSKGPRIALVHAVLEAIAPINEAFAAAWPQARVFNVLDDSLGRDLAADGKITAAMTQRFIDLENYCVDTGADAIQFTCSAFNECIDAAQAQSSVVVLKPDTAMIEEAFTYGPRLGVVVTFAPSADSITAQINACATAMGVAPQLDVRVAAGALQALRAGDPQEHDRLIVQAASELGPCDVVMLGQYSMARAAPVVQALGAAPLLTSPAAAVSKLRDLLNQ